MKIVSVLIVGPYNMYFDYNIKNEIFFKIGQIVIVPFKKTEKLGVIFEVKENSSHNFKLKEIVKKSHYHPSLKKI